MGFVGSVTATLRTDPADQPLRRRRLQAALGVTLAFAGIGHLTFARTTFQAQVPPWSPLNPDAVVLASGVVEVVLGCALVVLVNRAHRVLLGWLVAGFFVAVFPGNISQFLTQTDAFGLDTDAARALRLPFQPLLVIWALWSTQAWQTWQSARRSTASAARE